MKKTLLFISLMLAIAAGARAQIITEQDIEAIDMTQFDTDGDGKVKDQEAALAIKELYGLDKNNAITRVTVIEDITKSKEQIYVAVNDWFVRSFNDSKAVIQLNDKEAGCIIGKGYINKMGRTKSFFTNSDVSAYVIIRVDIRDNRMRITTTIQDYVMEKSSGTGMKILRGISGAGPISTSKVVNYIPSDCFPFTDKQKKEGAIGFVKGHIYSLVAINKLSDAVLNDLGGSDDW